MNWMLATEAPPGGGGAAAFNFFIIVLLFAVFYVLIIRPQQKRARDQRDLQASLGLGDRIVTIGGLHGTIQSVDEDTVRLEVAPNTVLTFARAAVARRLIDANPERAGDE